LQLPSLTTLFPYTTLFRSVVIHPGVDSQAYRPDPATPRAARPTFLYLGRLKRYKGVELAIRAVTAARTTRPDITLDICGRGDDRDRKSTRLNSSHVAISYA